MNMVRLWLKHGWHTCVRGGAAMVFALLLTIVSVAVAATGIAVSHAVQQVTARVAHSVAAVVFLADGNELDAQEMRARIKAMPGVLETTLTSPQDALVRAQSAMGGGRAPGAAGWEGIAMPWVIEVAHGGGDRQQWVASLSALPGVDQVILPSQQLDRFDQLIRVATLIASIVGLLFAGIIVVVVSHAIRLAMLLRQEELVVQQGLGASRSFVAVPIIVAGAGVGALGGMIGTLMFLFGSAMMTSTITAAVGIHSLALSMRTAAMLVVLATALGATAAAWSARTVLRQSR